ncbi:MAG TPA: XrtA/PEP-CTERM system TPR-repeat protein PrsT [Acetobacteraceae bacterium]
MRKRHLGWLLLTVWLGILPATVRADDLADARKALQQGDLRAAQINLRNAVRSDPQNAEAHFWLAKVSLELGDAVAAEREARAARDRGFDPHQVVPLLAQTMLAQQKAKDLLAELHPDGKDPVLDASILVMRGYAQIALNNMDDAQASFTLAEKTAPNAVEPLLAGARLLASRGDIAGAQAKIDRAINAQPKSPEALLAKAEILRTKGDATGSLAVLDQMLTDQPGNIRGLLDRAGLLIATGKADKAKTDLAAVLKATPGNVQAIYLQAVIQVQAKDYKAADATLDKINAYIGRIPRGYFLQSVVKEQLGQLAQAEDAIRRYIARTPNDLAGYKVLARIQFAKRRPDLAAESLAKVVESGQGDAEAYDLLGRAYAATGRSDESVKAFQKAESLAPDDVGLQTRLASARMGAGQAESAMVDLERTLELAPTAPQVGEALFFAALATGDLNKAADAVEKVRSAQGDTPVVQNLEGLLKLAQLDVDGAAAKFHDVLKKNPDFVPAQINLSRVSAMQGKPTEAEQLLTTLLDKNPSAEPALSMLVSRFAQTDRMPQAIALVEKARDAQPANTRLTASLGDLYIRSGKPAEALALINKDPNAANSVELLGTKAAAQIALEQKDQARDTYGQILKLDPSALGARRALESLLLQTGDYEHARNLIKEGMAVSPRNYQLYQDYAMVDLKASGVDAAVATAKQLQEQDRDFQQARALIGDIYMAANRPADAVRAYQDALAAAPSEMLVGRLDVALLRSGQSDAAVKMLSDWVAQHPADVVATEQLADIYIASRRYDEAVTSLQRVLDKKPHDPVALNNLAWVYQQQGDKRAQGLAQQAYVLSPGGQTADTLGWILVSSGNVAQGMPLLRQAASQAGSDPRILYHFAVALKEAGKRDEAIKMLNAVVANKGEFGEKAEAQKLLDELNKG